VNAYLVETGFRVVAVDSLLTVSDSRTMRAGLEELGKPLRACAADALRIRTTTGA
jgi:hypothetical protein